MLTSSRGFTLIELLVAMALLALLVMSAIPDATEWIRGTQVRTQAAQLVYGLQRARLEAIKRNQPVTFWLVTPQSDCQRSPTSAAYVVSLNDPTSKCNVPAGTSADPFPVEAYSAVYPGVTVTALANGGATTANAVTFNGYGATTNPGAQIARIELAHVQTARALQVRVSAAGSIRMCDTKFDNSSDPRRCQ
jgi:type IV fimbrial biogenesis protein FimT